MKMPARPRARTGFAIAMLKKPGLSCVMHEPRVAELPSGDAIDTVMLGVKVEDYRNGDVEGAAQSPQGSELRRWSWGGSRPSGKAVREGRLSWS